MTFIAAGPVTGRVFSNPQPQVKATAKYTIKLSNVTVGGLPAFVGDSCQTSAPVTIPVATPKGQVFDIAVGGTVKGTYTIGQFANCGLTTSLINMLVPGAGNTVTLKLSNGRFQS